MNKVNPRVDIAFKKIFGVEENKDLLISLINSVVSEEDKVTDVTLLNPYNAKNFKTDKLSILDIKAQGIDGKRFNIEIQITDEADYDKRALYYWAKLYTAQLKESDDYSKLSKAIGIHILNFTSIPELDEYYNAFHIVEKKKGFLYFEDLELHTVELKKFIETVKDTDMAGVLLKVKTSLDAWVAFLTKNDLLDKDKLPKKLEELGVKKALTVLEIMNFTDEERDGYEDHLKWLRIQNNTVKKYEQKAREEGREEGIQIGEAKLKEEKEKIVKASLKRGLDVKTISEITGLAKEEIEKIKKEM